MAICRQIHNEMVTLLNSFHVMRVGPNVCHAKLGDNSYYTKKISLLEIDEACFTCFSDQGPCGRCHTHPGWRDETLIPRLFPNVRRLRVYRGSGVRDDQQDIARMREVFSRQDLDVQFLDCGVLP